MKRYSTSKYKKLNSFSFILQILMIFNKQKKLEIVIVAINIHI